MFPFQVVGASWLQPPEVLDALAALRLPGVVFRQQPYKLWGGPEAGRVYRGLRMVVIDPAVFRPVFTSVAVLWALQQAHGVGRIWRHPQTRADFFDKLYGTDRVRKALLAGGHPAAIGREWSAPYRGFLRQRAAALLY